MALHTATDLYALGSRDLIDLGMSANQLRHKLHPERVVTYELRGRACSLEASVSETILQGGMGVEFRADLRYRLRLPRRAEIEFGCTAQQVPCSHISALAHLKTGVQPREAFSHLAKSCQGFALRDSAPSAWNSNLR